MGPGLLSLLKVDQFLGERNEYQKNKWTPHCQTEFYGNPKIITFLHLEDFYFGPNTALKKNDS
jgi:hypothetical protein